MRRPIVYSLLSAAMAAVLLVYVAQRNMAAPAPAKVPANPNISAVVKSSNQFAFDLYAKLSSEKQGNLFFSPQSISTALAMAYAGARSETASQMAGVLHFDLPPEQLHPAEAALLAYWNALGQQGNVKLSVANRLWGQRGYKFADAFTRLLRDDYGAGLEQCDFAESEAARKAINTWVEKATADKIKDLIPSGALNSLTRLVLTNAVYFKGDWQEAFRKEATKPSDFFLSENEKIAGVPLMFQKDDFRFGEAKFAGDREVKVLDLPYKGGQLSMVVLLPEAKDGLVELEKHFSADKLQQWLHAAKRQKVSVWLPKFKMTDQFQLGGVLAAMGMADAFDGSKADFSGIDGTRELFLSAVVHKAYVDVNEEGTEAAAATGIVFAASAAPMPSPEFRADHPFAFLIRDNTTGAILFMGRVVDPR
jgi:serpin B